MEEKLNKKDFKKNLFGCLLHLHTINLINIFFLIIIIICFVFNREIINILLFFLFISITGVIVYAIINIVFKYKVTEYAYDRYLKYGYVSRDFQYENIEVKLTLTSKLEKYDFTQNDYNKVWLELAEYLDNNEISRREFQYAYNGAKKLPSVSGMGPYIKVLNKVINNFNEYYNAKYGKTIKVKVILEEFKLNGYNAKVSRVVYYKGRIVLVKGLDHSLMKVY